MGGGFATLFGQKDNRTMFAEGGIPGVTANVPLKLSRGGCAMTSAPNLPLFSAEGRSKTCHSIHELGHNRRDPAPPELCAGCRFFLVLGVAGAGELALRNTAQVWLQCHVCSKHMGSAVTYIEPSSSCPLFFLIIVMVIYSWVSPNNAMDRVCAG